VSFAVFPIEDNSPERSSALFFTRVHNEWWAWHFVGSQKAGEKVYSMGCAIKLTKDPGKNLEKWAKDFHEAFAQATQRVFGTPDAPWDVMHQYTEQELLGKFNAAYKTMWQFGIEAGQPPKKLHVEMKKLFSLMAGRVR
jgi:hypothetical protein